MNARLILIMSILIEPSTQACTADKAAVAAPRHIMLSMRDAGKNLKFPSRTVVSLPFASVTKVQWPLAISQETPESVRLLTPQEFDHILHARAAIDKTVNAEPRLLPGLHLGLLYPGRAAIFLTNPAIAAPNTYRFDIEVSDDRGEDAAPRHALLKLQAKDQPTEHNVGYSDLVEITLPGSSLDEWDTDSAEAAGFSLRRKRRGGAGLVTLLFSTTAGGSGQLALASRAAGAPTYHFRFRRRATIAC